MILIVRLLGSSSVLLWPLFIPRTSIVQHLLHACVAWVRQDTGVRGLVKISERGWSWACNRGVLGMYSFISLLSAPTICRGIPSSPKKFSSRALRGWSHPYKDGQKKPPLIHLNLDFPAPAQQCTCLWVLMSCLGLEIGLECACLRTLKILLKNHLPCTLGWNALSKRGSKQTWQTFSH